MFSWFQTLAADHNVLSHFEQLFELAPQHLTVSTCTRSKLASPISTKANWGAKAKHPPVLSSRSIEGDASGYPSDSDNFDSYEEATEGTVPRRVVLQGVQMLLQHVGVRVAHKQAGSVDPNPQPIPRNELDKYVQVLARLFISRRVVRKMMQSLLASLCRTDPLFEWPASVEEAWASHQRWLDQTIAFADDPVFMRSVQDYSSFLHDKTKPIGPFRLFAESLVKLTDAGGVLHALVEGLKPIRTAALGKGVNQAAAARAHSTDEVTAPASANALPMDCGSNVADIEMEAAEDAAQGAADAAVAVAPEDERQTDGSEVLPGSSVASTTPKATQQTASRNEESNNMPAAAVAIPHAAPVVGGAAFPGVAVVPAPALSPVAAGASLMLESSRPLASVARTAAQQQQAAAASEAKVQEQRTQAREQAIEFQRRAAQAAKALPARQQFEQEPRQRGNPKPDTAPAAAGVRTPKSSRPSAAAASELPSSAAIQDSAQQQRSTNNKRKLSESVGNAIAASPPAGRKQQPLLAGLREKADACLARLLQDPATKAQLAEPLLAVPTAYEPALGGILPSAGLTSAQKKRAMETQNLDQEVQRLVSQAEKSYEAVLTAFCSDPAFHEDLKQDGAKEMLETLFRDKSPPRSPEDIRVALIQEGITQVYCSELIMVHGESFPKVIEQYAHREQAQRKTDEHVAFVRQQQVAAEAEEVQGLDQARSAGSAGLGGPAAADAGPSAYNALSITGGFSLDSKSSAAAFELASEAAAAGNTDYMAALASRASIPGDQGGVNLILCEAPTDRLAERLSGKILSVDNSESDAARALRTFVCRECAAITRENGVLAILVTFDTVAAWIAEIDKSEQWVRLPDPLILSFLPNVAASYSCHIKGLTPSSKMYLICVRSMFAMTLRASQELAVIPGSLVGVEPIYRATVFNGLTNTISGLSQTVIPIQDEHGCMDPRQRPPSATATLITRFTEFGGLVLDLFGIRGEIVPICAGLGRRCAVFNVSSVATIRRHVTEQVRGLVKQVDANSRNAQHQLLEF